MFSAMRFESAGDDTGQGLPQLALVDQRLLPNEERWLACRDLEQVAVAIEEMVVRGAPAIGCAAAYAVALDAAQAAQTRRGDGVWSGYLPRFELQLARLARTRPTAVNLFFALDAMTAVSRSFTPSLPLSEVSQRLTAEAQRLFADDIATCRAIGRHGADAAKGRRLRILTHCNTGSLATAGYGTALGVIRSLHAAGQVEMVFVDETRPYLQGARLTAYELKAEGIPYQLITDSMAAYVMQQGKVDWAIVGADRIAANGDTANKIGTYGVAVQCKHHGLEFYVAAPRSTFDPKLKTGDEIPVEERHGDEVRKAGGTFVAPADAPVFNPSFDVTPASLITGIITERGVLRAPYFEAIGRLWD